MSRPRRVFVEGGIYHVYNRITRGEAVFEQDDAAERFVSLLREVVVRDELTVFAWVLMSNHFHLAVRTGPISLDRPMRSLQQRITRDFNAHHSVYGPLWQGRYRAKMVEEQQYLDSLVAYIHLNPVSAGVVSDPADYRWTGHRDLIGRVRRPIVHIDEVLHQFGGTRRTARARYVRALKGAAEEDWAGELPGGLPWWRLGRPRKREEREVPQPGSEKAYVDVLGRSTGLERPAITVDDFVVQGSEYLGISVDDLAGRGRSSAVVRARELLATLGVERYGLRVNALARVINKSPEAVSRCVSRGVELRRADAEFNDRLCGLDQLLVESSASPSGDNETS
jgi:REP element-mobilizing transposase RayT